MSASLATSFLAISGAALVEGRSYVLWASASGSSVDAKVGTSTQASLTFAYVKLSQCIYMQVVLVVNEGPRGGSLLVNPMTGQALVTTFTAE